MKKAFLTLLVAALVLTSCNLNFNPKFSEKAGKGTDTTIELAIDKNLVETEGVSSIAISSTMIDDNGFPVASANTTYGEDKISGADKLSYDLENYGKHEITIEYKKGGKIISKDFVAYTLTADIYNIAILRATMPVTFFSMLMTKSDASINVDNQLPTIISIERAASYNWDKLYDNMYPCPFTKLSKLKANTSGAGNLFYGEFIEDMKSYVKYLHELNPDSKFNILLNDFSVEFLFKLIYENDMENMLNSVVFFSDGSGTYSYFRTVYGAAENEDKPSMNTYAMYEKIWASSKSKAANGDLSYTNDIEGLGKNNDLAYFGLMPIIVNDPNINAQWIVNRKNADTFGSSNAATDKVIGNSRVVAFNLSSHSSKMNDSEIQKLKDLFNLDMSDFEKAEQEGKKIMIFLGTRSSGETNLRDYLTFMKSYCVPDYAYFYKGHPGDSFNADREALLNEMDITILDASIPAELFLLFKPEVEMCGIQSSTFQSYTHAEIPFLTSSAQTQQYKDKVNTYITKNEDTSTSDIYPYRVIKLKDNQYSLWSPKDPDVFDWKSTN